MAVTYEKIVAEDLDVGTGTVVRHMPGGGTANAQQVNIGSFADPGVTVAAIGLASDHPGQLRVVSDLTTTTTGIAAVGGGANRGVVFSNGTTWKVVMA
jgi:hypothetical protein